MATKTWNGTTGSFSDDTRWSPQPAPTTGDVAVINTGSVTATGLLPAALLIALNASSSQSPELVLSAATLPGSSRLNLNASGSNASLRVRGAVDNQGLFAATGANPGNVFIQIDDALGGGPTTFRNSGTFDVSGVGLQVVTFGSDAGNTFRNDGLLSIRSPAQTPQLTFMAANMTGTGTVLLGGSVTFEAVRTVGAGQTVVFEGGVPKATTLRIDSGNLFNGSIAGFSSLDTIQLVSNRWNSAAYTAVGANKGVLTLSMNGVSVAAIPFNGSYTIESFSLAEAFGSGNSQAGTTIGIDPLFDVAYYLARYPDIGAAGVDPYQHFMTTGWKEGRNPSALFDVGFYLNRNQDVAAAGINPLTHFEAAGWKEGRDPSLAFSDSKYLATYTDVAAAGIDPLLHYVVYGKTEGRVAFLTGGSAPADPLIDAAYYDKRLGATIIPPGLAGQQQAAASYNAAGWKEGLNPSAYFSTAYYLRQNADVAQAQVDPLTHYETFGYKEGRDPSAVFSVRDYLATNADVRDAGVDPLAHWVIFGRGEGRVATPVAGSADPEVDAAYYFAANPDVAAAGVDAAAHYHSSGVAEGRNPNALFDTKLYLLQNPDVKAADADPLRHYELYGSHEGRDPSLLFSTSKYLAANPDVQAAGVDPLAHYMAYGKSEGRIAFLSGGSATADPLVDTALYDKQLGATLIPTGVAAAQQAAFSYDATGWQRGLNPDAFFDTNYYLGHNPDVAAAHVNPLLHYEAYGWHEGRDPSAQFSTAKYLVAYSDVAAAGVDPLAHYLGFGQSEGRTTFTA